MKYYLDCEFDGYGGPLISMGLVAEDSCELYFVMRETALNLWVRANVMPYIEKEHPLGGRLLTKEHAADAIAQFLRDDDNPVIVTDWPADIRYFCDLIEFPGGNMADIASLKFELHRVDAYPTTLKGAIQHHALWDARALKHLLTGGSPVDRIRKLIATGIVHHPGCTSSTDTPNECACGLAQLQYLAGEL